MITEQKIENDEKAVQAKTLWVLGLTFLAPIVITLIAFYIYI